MAGMTSHKSKGTSLNSKAAVPAVKKKAGGAGGQGQAVGNPANPTQVTWVWTTVAGQSAQTLITFSQPVIWSGGIPVNWRLNTVTAKGIVQQVTQINPTNWILTWNAAPNATTSTISVPQLDPTFKGAQGQFIQAGIQFSGPQK
jgi:hypothetical protein